MLTCAVPMTRNNDTGQKSECKGAPGCKWLAVDDDGAKVCRGIDACDTFFSRNSCKTRDHCKWRKTAQNQFLCLEKNPTTTITTVISLWHYNL